MLLADTLESVRVGVNGARGLWLVGLDGIIVAGAGDPGALPEEWLAASFSDIFRRVRAAGDEAELAPPVELVVTGPSGVVVVRPVDRDLALVAVVGPDAIPGRARHQLRMAAERLAEGLRA